MNRVLSIIILGLVLSCASTKSKETSQSKPTINVNLLKKNCDTNKDGLSCAKLAYHFQVHKNEEKAYLYYKKGCALGEETSCYNMKGSNSRMNYFKKVDAVMVFHKKNISNCHLKTRAAKQIYSSSQLKEKWFNVDTILHIDASGRADKISVNTDLSDKFKSCVKNEIRQINFPKPQGVDPTYTFNLTIRSLE